MVIWGWNHGLGQYPPTLQLPAPVHGIPAGQAAKIAAARVHSLVAADGALLSFGNGQNGRLGTGTSQSAAAPEIVPGLEGTNILQLACGHDHSMVLVAA